MTLLFFLLLFYFNAKTASKVWSTMNALKNTHVLGTRKHLTAMVALSEFHYWTAWKFHTEKRMLVELRILYVSVCRYLGHIFCNAFNIVFAFRLTLVAKIQQTTFSIHWSEQLSRYPSTYTIRSEQRECRRNYHFKEIGRSGRQQKKKEIRQTEVSTRTFLIEKW